MSSQPLVSILIVNWNGQHVLMDCLNSLEKISYKNIEVILVDNGSSDDSVQTSESFLKSKKISHKIILNDTNLGFAHANNQAFKVSKGEYVLMLNNDTVVTTNFLTIMVEKMRLDNKIGAMQPKIYMSTKKGYLDNAGSFLTSTGFLQHWGYGEKDSSEFSSKKEIFTAKGACLLTRREVISSAGLFDDKFGSYFEESDFCWRVWLSGWTVVFYPETHIYHMVGFTSKKMSQADVNYHSLKNRLRSLIVNLGTKSLFTILPLHISILIFLAAYYLLRLQFEKFNMILKAFVWNLVNFTNTLQRRREVQKKRKISDKDMFTHVMVSTNISEMVKHFIKVEKNFK